MKKKSENFLLPKIKSIRNTKLYVKRFNETLLSHRQFSIWSFVSFSQNVLTDLLQ